MGYYYEKTTWFGVSSPAVYPDNLFTLIGPFETDKDAKTAAQEARKTAPLNVDIGDVINKVDFDERRKTTLMWIPENLVPVMGKWAISERNEGGYENE